ncbi:HNH endonuclease [Thauera butanivorans]|uniref:HNH endonuclease n=1 Tax=Thauera butanivorans TaxID=86174 RepID=UPI003AB48A6B
MHFQWGIEWRKLATYNKDEFPDFPPFAKESVSLDNMRFDHYHDFKAANEKLGIGGSKPPGAPDFTWHHQDGKTMQLVPTSIHNAAKGGFPHAGGVSSSRN